MELAIELSLPHLLPSAFYDLSHYDPARSMAGTTQAAFALDVAASKEPVETRRERSVVLNKEMSCVHSRGARRASAGYPNLSGANSRTEAHRLNAQIGEKMA